MSIKVKGKFFLFGLLYIVQMYNSYLGYASKLSHQQDNLQTGESSEMELRSTRSQRKLFGIKSLPVQLEPDVYYETSGSPNFPSIDRMNAQGFFQFTTSRACHIAV
jgi:hypothetical protein